MKFYLSKINIPVCAMTLIIMMTGTPIYGVLAILLFVGNLYVFKIMGNVITDSYELEYQLLKKGSILVLVNVLVLYIVAFTFVQGRYAMQLIYASILFLTLVSLKSKIKKQYNAHLSILIIVLGIVLFSPIGYYLVALMSLYLVINCLYVIYRVKTGEVYYD